MDGERIRLRPEEFGRGVLRTLTVLLVVLAGLALVLAAGMAVQIVAGDPADPLSIGLEALLLVCALVIGVLAVVMLRAVHGSVRLTPDGLVNRQVRTRVIPRVGIVGIETQARGAYLRVRVELADGRRIVLAAPYARGTAPHPRFTADRDRIIAWWRQG